MSKCYIDEMNASVRFWFVFFLMLLLFTVSFFLIWIAPYDFFPFFIDFCILFSLCPSSWIDLIKLSGKYFHREIFMMKITRPNDSVFFLQFRMVWMNKFACMLLGISLCWLYFGGIFVVECTTEKWMNDFPTVPPDNSYSMLFFCFVSFRFFFFNMFKELCLFASSNWNNEWILHLNAWHLQQEVKTF